MSALTAMKSSNEFAGFWNEEMETLPREAMRHLQLKRLQRIVRYVYDNVEFYRRKYDAAGFNPADLRTLDDMRHVPFLTKEDLRQTYPYGLFAVPLSEIVRIHSSSGTTGTPVVAGYTQNDLNMWIEGMARTLACGGATKNDIIQIAYGYGLFTGGLGVHYAAERVGMTVVPISGGNTAKQLMILRDFGTTCLACTPSYGLVLAEALRDEKIDPASLKLRVGYFGAEPWGEKTRREIEKGLACKAIDIYGLTEVIGPGVASECLCQNGLHVFEDLYYPEIIDPVSLEPAAPGQEGELVFTTMLKEAFPVVRFRTRDLTLLDESPCVCGRTLARMKKVRDRTDDMIILRGVNVFPSQIEQSLARIEEVEPHYQIVLRRENHMDELEIQFEVQEHIFIDEIKQLQAVRDKVQKAVENMIGLRVKVTLVEPRKLERWTGKRKRVIDLRGEDQ